MQTSLFPSEPLIVVDDETGRVAYWPARVDAMEAGAWLAWLIEHVAWRSDRRIMYERAVDVPRLRANYALGGDESAPDVVLRCAGVAQEAAPAPYNSVGLNYYRNGGDGVAPHNDRISDLMEGEPIALLSLGGPRTMVISPKTHPRKAVRLSLESGSVLVMDYQSQHHYLHGIPKVRAADARISLAFRVRPSRTTRHATAANATHPSHPFPLRRVDLQPSERVRTIRTSWACGAQMHLASDDIQSACPTMCIHDS